MVAWYVWRFAMARNPLRLPIVLKHMLDRRRLRGMRYLTDIRDWLGGWPMEFVYDRDAIAFCEKLGLTLERIKTGEANTEFLFRRSNGA
jgi:2-polyprenyl-6-hydroxyphenyl methylase/3-demethylubiquinone-9 3-methyltransferase